MRCKYAATWQLQVCSNSGNDSDNYNNINNNSNGTYTINIAPSITSLLIALLLVIAFCC